jgi:hypothetical protein
VVVEYALVTGGNNAQLLMLLMLISRLLHWLLRFMVWSLILI